MPIASQTTIDRLREFIGDRPLRVAAIALGLPPEQAITLSTILNGKRNISRPKENEIRRLLNLFPRGVSKIANVPIGYLAYLINNRMDYEDLYGDTEHDKNIHSERQAMEAGQGSES